MKFLCSMLFVVVALHAECRVLCFAGHVPAKPQPACHESSSPPAGERPSDGDDANSCGQEPGIQSRIISVVKCGLDSVALEPVAPVVLLNDILTGILPFSTEPSPDSPRPLRFSVLRI